MHNHDHSSGGRAIGAFLAGAAVALLASGYLLYGPGGRHRRDELEERLDAAKDQILERMAELKDTTRASYDALVDEVLENYAVAKDLAQWQVRLLSARLKARYRQMQKLARESTREARRETENDDGEEL